MMLAESVGRECVFEAYAETLKPYAGAYNSDSRLKRAECALR